MIDWSVFEIWKIFGFDWITLIGSLTCLCCVGFTLFLLNKAENKKHINYLYWDETCPKNYGERFISISSNLRYKPSNKNQNKRSDNTPFKFSHAPNSSIRERSNQPKENLTLGNHMGSLLE